MKNATRAQRTVTLPEDVYEALMQGKQVSIERPGAAVYVSAARIEGTVICLERLCCPDPGQNV